MLTAAELAVALRISVRQVQRLGLPHTPVGVRGKRYDLAECQAWLREQHVCPSAKTTPAAGTSKSAFNASAFTAASRQVQLRVMPSSSRPSSCEPSASDAPPLSLVTP